MFSKNSAVQHIFYFNLLLYISSLLFNGLDNYLLYFLSCWNWNTEYFSSYQLITYQFLHKDFVHLFFNMIVLISVGPLVEKRLDYNKFFLFYLLSGVFGAMLHMSMFNEGTLIGASGSIWGMLVMYMFFYPNDKLSPFLLPIEVESKYLVSFLFLIEVIFCIFVKNTGVSHWAHVGGALTGGILYYFVKSKRYGKKTFNT